VIFDELIDQYAEDIDFDALKHWAAILGVDYDPPLDDMWPDWEDELRTEIGEAIKDGVKQWTTVE